MNLTKQGIKNLFSSDFIEALKASSGNDDAVANQTLDKVIDQLLHSETACNNLSKISRL